MRPHSTAATARELYSLKEHWTLTAVLVPSRQRPRPPAVLVMTRKVRCLPGHRVRSALRHPLTLPALAVLASAALYADLPARFIAHSAGVYSVVRWLVPGLTVLLLLALVMTFPGLGVVDRIGFRGHRLHVTRRVMAVAMICVLSLANLVSIALLVHLLVNGAHANAALLLRAALHMWVVNILLFALWFWELDGGGPTARPGRGTADRDFLFPQQTIDAFRNSGWEPTFVDYLYLSFTNAAAFSPTDTMPLSSWSKLLMLAESAISLSLGVMVVARAINILQ
jgi:uncharacterized membrane protein